MNIAAERVVRSMEEQLKLLKQAIDEQDQQAVREYTSVIEGYCRLLKDGPAHIQTTQLPPAPQKQAVSPISAPTTQEANEKPGSLFDF